MAEAVGSDEEGDCTDDQADCRFNCENSPFDQGGCAPAYEGVGDDETEGDSYIRILPGMTGRAEIKLQHCTQNLDALRIHGGQMSFVTLQGSLEGRLGNRILRMHPYVALYRSFAAAGHASPNKGLKGKAYVWVNGTRHVWPYPGALPFSLMTRIPDIDMSKATQVVWRQFEYHGGDKEKKRKSARYNHWNDYDGITNNFMTVMFYQNHMTYKKRGGSWWRRAKWGFTNCDYTTTFEARYFPKS